jgi:hypothetical protein
MVVIFTRADRKHRKAKGSAEEGLDGLRRGMRIRTKADGSAGNKLGRERESGSGVTSGRRLSVKQEAIVKFRELKRRELIRLLRGGFFGVLCVLTAVLFPQWAAAQTFSGSIAGTVTDSSGAVVRGVKLQLEETETKDIRLKTSAEDGTFNFTNLMPGTYKISATSAGYKDYVRTEMILRANTAATVDVTLQVGDTSEQVMVTASAVLMDSESANNAITMDSALIESLPNSTLQPLNFIFAMAGSTESQGGMTSRSQTFDQMGSMFGINGGRTGESEILIDGAPSTAIDWGGLIVSPMQDSVQEQQVVQNEYDAQYERGGEGVVTLITKSGTANFHGEAYDFMRNSWLDANSWSNGNQGYKKSLLHRNQFGGNFGGPVWRRRNIYFFGAYEGLRQPQTEDSGLLTVPTADEIKGVFTNTYNQDGSPVVIYNPFSTHQVTDAKGNKIFTRDPFPNNVVPAGLIDKVGAAIASLYPAPNHANNGPGDKENFTKQGSGMTSNDKFDWRVDWNQSPAHRIFVRMSDRMRENNAPPCFFCNGADNEYGNEDRGFQVVINDTYTPNQTWVIDTYGAYSRWFEGQTAIGLGKASPATIGLSPSLFQAPLLPVVGVGPYAQLGNSNFDEYVRYLSTGLINVTKQLHSHALKFGFNYDVSMINNRQDSPANFGFGQSMTSCDPNPEDPTGPCMVNLSTGTTGSALASLLLGAGSGATSISMDPAMSVHAFGMYLQDNWRLSQRWTVTAGLRYENQLPATERYNRVAYFDPQLVNPISAAFGSNVYGGFEFAGVGGRGRGAWESDNKNFGPRAGVAYRFSNKLVGRVGSGIFFGPSSAMLSFDGGGQSPGYTATTNWIGTQGGNGYIPSNLVSNPFPNGIVQPTGNALGAGTYLGNGTSQMWTKGPHPVGNIYQWSMDFQYQVSPHSVAEIGYTGVRGRKLLFGNPNLDLDQLPTKDLSIGNHLYDLVDNPFYGVITDPNAYLSAQQVAYNATLRPFPEFGWLQQTRSLPGARSQFDAFSAKYNHSFANGLSSLTTYQFSKNLDDGSEALLGWTIGGSWRDATNPKLDYSISTHDVPQSFAEAWVYQLPYGHDRRWGGTSPQIVNQILGDWSLSGAVRLSSGLPLWNPVDFSYNPVGNFGFPGNGLPNVIGNPKPKHRTTTNWIDQTAFQGVDGNTGAALTCNASSNQCQPFQFSYGNEPQHMSSIREAPTKNLDLGVSKDFVVERFRTQIRGDFLNVFNHPIYGGSWNIGNDFNWDNVGQVYGTRNDPRNIQVSVKVTY